MKLRNSKKSASDSNMTRILIKEYKEIMDTKFTKEKKSIILDLFTNYNQLSSKEELNEINDDLHQACEEGNLELIKILLSEKIEYPCEGFTFKVDKKNKTASLFRFNIIGDSFELPREVKLGKDYYLITSICGTSGGSVRELTFAKDSAVETIYERALSHFCCETIYFPSSLIELKNGWCIGTNKLKKIVIPPSNKNFLFKDNKFLVGKSDNNSNQLDTLMFVRRQIRDIFVIPPNISFISPYAFYECYFLEKVIIPANSNLKEIGKFAFANCIRLETFEIEADSNLQVIGEYAFYLTNIKNISIPPKVSKICKSAFYNCRELKNVNISIDSNLQIIEKSAFERTKISEIYFPASLKELKEGWCDMTEYLTKITISPLDNRFIFKDDKYLLGKSDENNDEFDILLFASRKAEKISIPSNIKIISECAFQSCKQLSVKIQNNSKLQIIGKFAFEESHVEEIYIPQKVSKICDCAFHFLNTEKIHISENSILKIIGVNAFSGSNIKEISIPSSTEVISSCAFENCRNLTKVEIPLNSNLHTIGEHAFGHTKIKEIFIPSTVSKICCSAFYMCSKLTKVNIEPNSNLQAIESTAFGYSGIKDFYITSKVSIIDKRAFICCDEVIIIEISEESKLKSFSLSDFTGTKAMIMIPVSLKILLSKK